MPNFRFSEDEVNSITMVLTSMVKDIVPMEMSDKATDAVTQGRILIAEKNCKGCHIIEGAGGDIRGALKDQAQWPPNLATQGYKTQPGWLHPFLKDPSRVRLRPWLSARMPTFHFTEEEAAAIGRYFSAVDNVEYPFISTEIDTTPERLRVGQELFTKMQCAQCHPQGNTRPPGRDEADLAPDLQLASERLRPNWVLDWLLDPQKIMPGTRMPMFFAPASPGGPPETAFKDLLGGDVKAQIQAIRDHLFLTVGRGRRTTANVTN
jgi:mono/diheme cytochrome c family protein